MPAMDLFGFDAFSPREWAARLATPGVAEALRMAVLAPLADAFIGLGAMG